MKRAIVFGSRGALGSSIIKKLHERKCHVICIDQKFTSKKSKQKIKKILEIEADVVFNCMGKFGGNDADWHEIFFTNVGLNWFIISALMEKGKDESIHFISFGSTATNQPRRNYMNYASSKTALKNLFCSASDFFQGSQIKLTYMDIPKFRSQMTKSEEQQQLPSSDAIAEIVFKEIGLI